MNFPKRHRALRLVGVRRLATAAALVLAVLALPSAGAAALTVSPAGTYDETSTDMNLEVRSNGQRALCSTTAKQFTIASNGIGSFALGDVTFSGCSTPLFAWQRMDQTAAWGLVVTLLTGGGVAMTITVPTDGLLIENPICKVWLGGTITKLAASTTLPATVTTFATSATTLRATRVAPTHPFCGVPVGLALGMYLTLTLDRAMTVAG